MDRKDGLIHMILGENRIRWGRGEEKTESTVLKKRNVSIAKTTQNRPLATLLYILETDLTGKRFNLIYIFSKINLKKLVNFFSLSLAKKESK